MPAAAPAAAPAEGRLNLEEWLAEWRDWLGGAVITSGIRGARRPQKGELTDYSRSCRSEGGPAAVLTAIAIWPRDPDGGDGAEGGRTGAAG